MRHCSSLQNGYNFFGCVVSVPMRIFFFSVFLVGVVYVGHFLLVYLDGHIRTQIGPVL